MSGQMEERNGELDPLVVARAQQGDAASREELLRVVRGGVLRYLIARGLPDHDAEDLAQETCLGVLAALPRWNDRGHSLWALVFTIARRRMADRASARNARRDIPMGDHGYADLVTDHRPEPAELLERDEGAHRVRRLMQRLPNTQREVLLLRVVVGLSSGETAAALGLTVGSVRVLQHRAVTTLRASLGASIGGTHDAD